MSCGFGAVVLVFLIIDHSMEIEIRTVNAEVLSEVALLEEDIVDGEAGLVRLRNALTEADLEIVEADGRARRITEELDEYETADAGEIFISTDEMVDHVVLEYSVPATREIRALCSDLINRNVDHKVFNQITKELDWEQPRPFQFGVGYVHARLCPDR